MFYHVDSHWNKKGHDEMTKMIMSHLERSDFYNLKDGSIKRENISLFFILLRNALFFLFDIYALSIISLK